MEDALKWPSSQRLVERVKRTFDIILSVLYKRKVIFVVIRLPTDHLVQASTRGKKKNNKIGEYVTHSRSSLRCVFFLLSLRRSCSWHEFFFQVSSDLNSLVGYWIHVKCNVLCHSCIRGTLSQQLIQHVVDSLLSLGFFPIPHLGILKFIGAANKRQKQ